MNDENVIYSPSSDKRSDSGKDWITDHQEKVDVMMTNKSKRIATRPKWLGEYV